MITELQNPPATETGDLALATETATTDLDWLRQELAAQKSQKLHQAADFENFKRRSRHEEEARALALKEAFIYELLPTIDNLERALASGSSNDSLPFHQGVELTLLQLRRLLRQHGIEPEESLGQPFDPHRHEAVSQRHDPAQPDHTILEVFQRGYLHGDNVFRPAKVVVNDWNHSQPLPQA